MKLFLVSLLFIFHSPFVKADTVDNYQIYIRKELVRNESGFPKGAKNKEFIIISKSICAEFLELHYHHCSGYQGKRKVALINSNSTVIQEFNFYTENYDAAMYIPISFFCDSKDLKTNVAYSLIYYDSQIKEGLKLTDIKVLK